MLGLGKSFFSDDLAYLSSAAASPRTAALVNNRKYFMAVRIIESVICLKF